MNVKFRLAIGLGNPGKEYEKTYHNAGFLFIDYLNQCQMSDVRCRVLKSEDYMNQSGDFVKRVLKKYHAKPAETLIIHDDSDIEIGRYKLSFGRGSAGHRGVESIIKALKTKEFWRLRIGVRRGSKFKIKDSRLKAEDFVLKKMSKRDEDILKNVFQKIIESGFQQS